MRRGCSGCSCTYRLPDSIDVCDPKPSSNCSLVRRSTHHTASFGSLACRHFTYDAKRHTNNSSQFGKLTQKRKNELSVACEGICHKLSFANPRNLYMYYRNVKVVTPTVYVRLSTKHRL